MGCVSSKLFKKELTHETFIFNNGGDYINHVVSLTSSTYGVLKLDNDQHQQSLIPKSSVTNTKKSPKRSPIPEEPPEVINAWELMEDLEDDLPMANSAKKSPKACIFLRGFGDIDARSPLKLLGSIGSPRRTKKFGGKENKNGNIGSGRFDYSENSRYAFPLKMARVDLKTEVSSRRKSLDHLFDPELVSSYEKELFEEEEQIKPMVFSTPKTGKLRNCRGDENSILNFYEKKCPPGGENAVIFYTTTLRGIRKTFEDCNVVRATIESHNIQTFERDISMDSGFKEELRRLMGTKHVKVPIVFVKGRLIGGVDEVLKLEEEGRLGVLFDGISMAAAGGCEGCGGVRFVMCMDCNGSCKVLEEDGRNTKRCSECNENGLIQCPICC